MGRITDLQVTHVSIVDKAANRRKFLLMKSDEQQPNVEQTVRVVKSDAAEQILYGVVYEPLVKDAHDDYMTADDIEKAAHMFLKDYRQIDKQHDFVSQVGEVIESYISPVDFTMGDELVTKGTWVMAVKVDDETWQAAQDGLFTGFSLAGYGNVEKAHTPTEDVLTKEESTFFAKLKKFFAPLLEHEQVQKEQGEEVMTMTKDELQTLVTETVAEAVAKALAKEEDPKEPASPQVEPDVEPVVQPEAPQAEPEQPTEQTELAKALERIAELEKQVDARPVAFSSGAEVVAKSSDKPSYCQYV